MKNQLVWVVIAFTVLFSVHVNATVKLPRLISDGMVLQRDVPLNIWGWADPAEKVKIEFLGKTYHAKADKAGNWKLELPALSAGGPFNMKVNEIEIHDILIGDVWLCSGQSNMELFVYRVLDLYQNEIQKVNNSNIRYFKPSVRNDAQSPVTDFNDGSWLPATPANIMNFAAVPYFFGAELYKKYKVPIGLINTAIGGSPLESWLSKDHLKKYIDKWQAAQARMDSIRASRKLHAGNASPFNFSEELSKSDPGIIARWSKSNVDVSDWPQISLPGYWSEKGVDLRLGSIWFYKEFDIPDSLLKKDAILRMGRIIDSDSAFVNGTFVGTISYQYPPRIYELPAGILKPGKNKLMLRVICQGGKGGFVEEKPYEVRIGSQKIDLTGDWKYHTGAALKPSFGRGQGGGQQFSPAGLYNRLISPVIGFKLKGTIWYQGESNTDRGLEYRQLFKDLITEWRTKFAQPDMPFLFAQLANLGIPNKQPVESGWADVREAQRRALELPNTGMAVTFDIGEWNDIHPLNKKEVSRRLALEAARVAYHDSSALSSGPLYESMETSGSSIVLTFKSVGSGLFTNCLLDGFQIAGTDGKFEWADAVTLSRNKVKVWSKKVSNPTIVRYAWDDNPVGANLKNKEGLPASPFTTDK
jgi:sialate O-acetylesterase